jgi:tetratricopeptide (TPR) repeat protein
MLAKSGFLNVIGNRYQLLDKVGEGGMGAVYRAADRLDGSIVALKSVTTPGEKLQFASKGGSSNFRLALAQEFRVLASLRHPNIISVLDYGFDAERQPYFTMELLNGGQTLKAFCSGKPIAEQVALLRQILEALAYLHRRGILHRDLKPDNLLVIADNSMSGDNSPSGGQLKVLDFGLAVAREALTENDETVGTIAYMAPEVLSGGSPGEASDLYAFGVIAYELLAGHYPFPTQNASGLVQAIFSRIPDVWSLEIDEPLKEILERLLAKSPDQRHSSASELLSIFARYSGDPVASETASIRESYLQAARFVGRDQELEELTGALDKMIGGQGSAWLIGGESGVGKSRLLDELRTQALVSGALALRGQAIAEGGAPYHLWREALRRLCLQTEFTELEASVLKSLVPDIGTLIGREVANAPEIDTQAAQTRLLTVIEDVFRRQKQPVMLLLEDLHWARESLIVLNRLIQVVEQLPLLIIANYRDDERPDLPDELPAMQRIKLTRLDTTAIGELSASMLGESGRQPQVIDLLQRETEGNVFFIVEVVRALAEEAGQLAQIGRMTLPQSVFAGGVLTVVQRRLSRVPAASRPLLQIAAVAGRELDLAVLTVAAPGTNTEAWLNSVSSVIDVQDNRYRFAHDKLREGLLQNLSDERLRALHQMVAEATIAAYPDDPAQYAILHYHWEEAGDLDCARHYAELGGEAAFKNAAYEEAVRLLIRALELQPKAVSQRDLARWHHLLGAAYLGGGHTLESRPHLEKAMTLLGYPVLSESSNLRIGLDILYQLVRHLLFRLMPRVPDARDGENAALSPAIAISHDLNRIYVTSAAGPVLASVAFRAANWLEASRTSPYKALTTATLGVIFDRTPFKSFAESYFQRSRLMLKTVDSPQVRHLVATLYGFHYATMGIWEEATSYLRDSVALGFQSGNWRSSEEMYIYLAYAYLLRGMIPDVEQVSEDIKRIAERTKDYQVLSWAYRIDCDIFQLRGDWDRMDQALRQSASLIEQEEDSTTYSVRIFQAVIHFRRSEFKDAFQTAQAAVEFAEKYSTTGIGFIRHYSELARVCIGLWNSEDLDPGVRNLTRRMRRLLSTLKFMPPAMPSVELYEGIYAFLNNQPRRANGLWQSSLTAARKLQMPYDEARALYEIGRHLPVNDPRRAENLKAAAAIFERLGAAWELKQTQRILAQE